MNGFKRSDSTAHAVADAVGSGVGGLGRAVAGIEVRRTGAVWIGSVVWLIGVVLLVAKQPPFQQYNNWSSTWADAAGWLSVAGLVLGPLIGTAAAWVGGRERRGRLRELIATTSRPAALRLLATWTGMVVGVLGGYVAYAAVVAVAIAPEVSYGGGRWEGAWWLAGLGWVSCAGIGYAAGRLVPGRLVAPAVGIAIYLGCGSLGYFNGTWIQLAPVAQLPTSGGYQLLAWVIPVASVWLLSLTATSLVLALRLRWTWALLPATLATVAALPLTLVGHSSHNYAGASWVEPDPAATRRVCTADEPRVCVFAYHAGLLPAITPVARTVLASASRLVTVNRAVEADNRHPAPAGAVPLPNLSGYFRAFRGGLVDPAQVRRAAAFELAAPRCRSIQADDAFYSNEAALDANEIAVSLVNRDPSQTSGDLKTATVLRDLAGNPTAARAWMAKYTEAAHTCNVPVLSSLAEGL